MVSNITNYSEIKFMVLEEINEDQRIMKQFAMGTTVNSFDKSSVKN